MADTISRSDIQYAVQSALQDVRSEVSRITYLLDAMNRVSRDGQDILRRVQSLERSINQIQNTLASTLGSSQGQRHPDPRIAGLCSDMAELKIRFVAIERFAAQMSEYVRKQHAQDEEDKQYRMS